MQQLPATSLRASILATSFFLGCLLLSSAAETLLFDFKDKFDLGRVAATDAKAVLESRGDGGVLRVMTGHKQPWPGITLPAPGGFWDLSAHAELAVEVANPGTNTVTVYCRVDNPGADGTRHCVTASLELEPGKRDVLKVSLPHAGGDKLGGKLFGMRGYPVAAEGTGAIDPRRINQLVIFVSQPQEDHVFELRSIRALGTHTPPTAWITDATPFFPFVDTLGQYRHKDWPGKTRSPADLVAQREQEAKELASKPAPKDWDKYGGWAAGPSLKATGFFRTEKHKGKWWLVDPDGRLFFSHGIDCVRMLDSTPIDERDTWFDSFPGNQPDLAEFLSNGYALKGHYAGRSPRCYSFAGANLKRKYGANWREVCPPIIHQRLRSWGLNTIANWSDQHVWSLRLTPYTDTIASGNAKRIAGSEGYWGQFPDVFDPGFTDGLRKSMESRKGKSANDPWCLGYFSDNEMSWGNELSLALATLKSPADQPAKRILLADLKSKYGDIGKLNAAWGSTHASWDALLDSRDAPDKDKARDDLAAFYTKVAEQYFRAVRDAIRAVAPHQLYLGCRFAWVNARAAAAAARFCDVVSYNLYQRSVADFKFNGGADVPLIIGEFHFGALDRGMFHTGLVSVENQAARAALYKDYVLGAVRHPQFVGCHWFQYQDEPLTGRVYDEENYQIGFVDVADTPYEETITASREVAERLYQ